MLEDADCTDGPLSMGPLWCVRTGCRLTSDSSVRRLSSSSHDLRRRQDFFPTDAIQNQKGYTSMSIENVLGARRSLLS